MIETMKPETDASKALAELRWPLLILAAIGFYFWPSLVTLVPLIACSVFATVMGFRR